MMSNEEQRAKVQAVQKAEFAARVDDLNALREVFGKQDEEIVQANRAKKIKADWRRIADMHGRNDIQGIKETLWNWVLDEGIEYEVTDTEKVPNFG